MPKGIPGSKAPHGTPTRYVNHGCRCESCSRAWSEYREPYRRALGQRPKAEYLASVEAAHGTESRYKRCKCAECREAARVARARRRAALHG